MSEHHDEAPAPAVILKCRTVEGDTFSRGRMGERLEIGAARLEFQAYDRRHYIPNAVTLNQPIVSLPRHEMDEWLKRHGYKPHPLGGGVWVN